MESNEDISKKVEKAEIDVPKGWFGRMLDDLSFITKPKEPEHDIVDVWNGYNGMFKEAYRLIKSHLSKKGKE